MIKKLEKLGFYVEKNADMAKYTTIKAGGRAKCLLHIKNLAQLQSVLALLRKHRKSFVVLGKGSKILFVSAGIVIKLCGEFEEIKIDGTQIRAGSAASTPLLSALAANAGLTGCEFLQGIPASVGGVVTMNAGCFGSNVAKLVHEVKVMRSNGEVHTLNAADCGFAYRTSVFKTTNDIVLSATFNLQQSEPEEVLQKIAELAAARKAKQPQGLSLGSSFKNPSCLAQHAPLNCGMTKPTACALSAGELIDKCGLKGAKYGCAVISNKHANFILNNGGATARHIIKLLNRCKRAVYNKYKIKLKEEIIIVC